jgi:ribosomal protein L34
MRKRHINEFYKTTLANSGRAAGAGIAEDNYSEDSGLARKEKRTSGFEHICKGEDGEVVVVKRRSESNV